MLAGNACLYADTHSHRTGMCDTVQMLRPCPNKIQLHNMRTEFHLRITQSLQKISYVERKSVVAEMADRARSSDSGRILCTAFLSNNRFIVMSLLNAGDEGIGTTSYAQLAQINADLAQTYPDNFVGIREILVNNYDPTNLQDIRDHNNDVPPSSLRNDNEHLNDKGYGIVAQQIAAYIAAKGW